MGVHVLENRHFLFFPHIVFFFFFFQVTIEDRKEQSQKRHQIQVRTDICDTFTPVVGRLAKCADFVYSCKHGRGGGAISWQNNTNITGQLYKKLTASLKRIWWQFKSTLYNQLSIFILSLHFFFFFFFFLIATKFSSKARTSSRK